jgi:hypothetical protein
MNGWVDGWTDGRMVGCLWFQWDRPHVVAWQYYICGELERISKEEIVYSLCKMLFVNFGKGEKAYANTSYML